MNRKGSEVSEMIKTNGLAAFLLLGAAACATGGGSRGGVSERFMQADQHMPSSNQILDDMERQAYAEATDHQRRGDIARESGNMDQARAEWAAAGDGLAAIPQRFGANEYQIPYLYGAAQLLMQAQAWEKAAVAAQRAATDVHANDMSKAMGWHAAAQAWVNVANQDAKAGKIDPIRLAYAEQRGGKPLTPRTPPGAWKSFVDATDGYLAKMHADPDLRKPAAERRYVAPAQLALIAAEVEYAFDNLEEARRRLDLILETFPGEGEVLVDAVPLYLQTFLIQGDRAGYQVALERVGRVAEAEAQKAADPGQRENYAKVKEALGRAEAGSQFAQAQRLLDDGKAAQAAEAFEALARQNVGGDVAGALHNAAIAWDKAEQPVRAAVTRDRILKEFPDSKVAPQNALLLAAHASRKNDHASAAQRYGEFLQKWPDDPQRCLALQNAAAEFDQASRRVDAAEGYLVFGKDVACAKADPNFAARALYRAGALLEATARAARAKEAFAAAAAVQGVTDTVAKSQVDDARRRLKGK